MRLIIIAAGLFERGEEFGLEVFELSYAMAKDRMQVPVGDGGGRFDARQAIAQPGINVHGAGIVLQGHQNRKHRGDAVGLQEKGKAVHVRLKDMPP